MGRALEASPERVRAHVLTGCWKTLGCGPRGFRWLVVAGLLHLQRLVVGRRRPFRPVAAVGARWRAGLVQAGVASSAVMRIRFQTAAVILNQARLRSRPR